MQADVLISAAIAARELGNDAALEKTERVLREGNGADEQRRVHRAMGMDGLLEYLAEQTRR